MDIINKYKLTLVIFLVVGLVVVGYFVGYLMGGKAGYGKAQADQKKLQEVAAMKATEEAVKAANPFQVTNPLQEVETNPFEKTENILNPFR